MSPAAPLASTRPPDGLGHTVAFTLMSVALSVPLAIYNLLLVERKWGVLLAWDQFFASFRLAWWETAIYVTVFLLAVVLFVVTLSGMTHCLFGRWAAFAAAVGYFLAVTAQFEVLRYFRDELSLALIQKISGGRMATLAYLTDETAAFIPVSIAFLCAAVYARQVVRNYFALASIWLGRRWFIQQLATRRGLLTANLLMVASVPAVAAMSHPAHAALELSLAHRAYAAAVDWVSDIDRDGYGWLAARTDFAPWDASRHPFAIEIPGNGIDENGIAGDLPSQTKWPVRPPLHWDIDKKNVLLIVMDSARADLVSAHYNRRPVMPVLAALPAASVALVSHGGRTVPSVTGMLNGTLTETERAAVPLLDAFTSLGYQTAIFSGQHEGFGGIASRTRMRSATAFFDASMDVAHRMHGSTTPAALTLPAPLVNRRFREWFEGQRDRRRPFFAYLNWQEMHFPYHYAGAPKPLLDEPIPRASIAAAHRDWVRATYYNAARTLDAELAAVLALLEAERSDTLIVILGDHGEELFDRGYLGHGIDISLEQNLPLCRIAGAARPLTTAAPVGIADLPVLIHNALTRGAPAAFQPDPLCYVGSMEAPSQIGVVESAGSVLKYDFARDAWSRQIRAGVEFTPAAPSPELIHRWESYLVAMEAAR